MKIIDLEQEDGRCPWHDMLPQGLIRTCHKRAHEDWGDPQQTIGKRRGSSKRYKRCHLRVVMWRTRHRQQRDEVPRTLYDWEQWEYGERGRTLSLLFLHPFFFLPDRLDKSWFTRDETDTCSTLTTCKSWACFCILLGVLCRRLQDGVLDVQRLIA